MGKRIIQQARGHGSLTYRVRPSAYKYKVAYPSSNYKGEAKIIEIINSSAHTAPLVKIQTSDRKIFYNIASNGLYEGQIIKINENEIKEGNILMLKDIPTGTNVFNLENNPNDGGKFVRTSGNSAKITKKVNGKVAVLMPSKKEKWFNEKCRATIGIIAGQGRLEKPFVKAGNKYYKMKSRNKLWPRTSAVKMNAVDHPFGGGRGKRIKSKIAKRNAPPGAKVGHIRPRRTGLRKK
ncbi:MAG: 50S ribosomal protein L2 [Candidatus Pacearchaeota archaeon]